MRNLHNDSWMKMLEKLVAHKEKTGVANVTATSKGDLRLFNWVNTQRYFAKAGRLSSDRVAHLNEIGFVWNPVAERGVSPAWSRMYAKLADHAARHGSANVPRRGSDNQTLANWVWTQRQHVAKGNLSAEQIDLLNRIGFVWDPLAAAWLSRFEELRVFHATHGHCNADIDKHANPDLSRWILTQRALKGVGKLSSERIQMLESIGFSWTGQVLNFVWNEMFQRLVAHASKYGTTSVPHRWAADPKLAAWVSAQRQARKAGKLSAERIDALDSINFVWAIRAGAKSQRMPASVKSLSSKGARHEHRI